MMIDSFYLRYVLRYILDGLKSRRMQKNKSCYLCREPLTPVAMPR